MPSIYQRALGSDFSKLHPKIQERFGFSSDDCRASIGVGIMERMWHGPFWTRPFLSVGSSRRIMFPETCNNTRFVIENYAYCDQLGRETVTWIRTFDFPSARRRFDAYMIYSQERRRVVDYLGTHQHLAVDLELRVADNGGLHIISAGQRFYEHLLGFRFPALFTGTADVVEWYDDVRSRYRIRVDVHNRRFGPLFGYEGAFDAIFIHAPDILMPREIMPLRTERRE